MKSLNQLIKKYGEPDALIDHWDTSSRRFAIWGFKETFQINNKGEGIINGKKSNIDLLNTWQKYINKWKTSSRELATIGYFSYDLKNLLFPEIKFKKLTNSNPLIWFGKPNHIEEYTISKTDTKPEILFEIQKDIINPNHYKNTIDKIKQFLLNGESYQINFTQPKYFSLFKKPFETYQIMRSIIKPHYGMYLNIGEKQILSFSPECFFKKNINDIETFPMKGTRPRSNNYKIDNYLKNNLFNSKKDRAEHLMIVDLLRNDIGKLCQYGTIKVDDLYGIHSYKTVHQMVSRVYGKLNKSINESDIIKALFPGGSITGAPKERSMEIIDKIENYQRDIYTGSLGYIKNNGDMNFNIAIRTLSITKNKGIYPIGGGIVWDSKPLDEWKEAQQKSAIMSPFIKKSELNVNKHKTNIKN